MRSVSRSTRVLVVVSAILLFACTVESGPETPLIQLESARERWAAAGHHSYRFIFENDCGECPTSSSEPREVIVEAGAAATLEDPTVESLFGTIEQAIADDSSVEVTYDPDLGHPTEIWIDREARAYDGGTHWMVRDLAPVR